MKANYSQLAMQLGQLLGLAQGMELKLAHLTKQGIEFVFESETTRAQVSILPKVYTEGKVIIDAINDVTLIAQVKQIDIQSGNEVGGGQVELPYSTWFFEGDYV